MSSLWEIRLKYIYHKFFIHFGSDFRFTLSFWRSGTFWADDFNSKGAQFDEIFHLIHILAGWSRACCQRHRQKFKWRSDLKPDLRSGFMGPEYPRDDRETSKLRLWVFKHNLYNFAKFYVLIFGHSMVDLADLRFRVCHLYESSLFIVSPKVIQKGRDGTWQQLFELLYHTQHESSLFKVSPKVIQWGEGYVVWGHIQH